MYSSDTQKSVRQLAIYLGICLAAVCAAVVFRTFHLHFWTCQFHAVTGFYCLSCGATRAAIALSRLDFIGSLRLNPLPVMLAALMLGLIGFELYNIFTKKKRAFRWFPHTVIVMLAVLLIYAILRNIGLAPIPG